MSKLLTVEEEDAKNLARCKKCANYVESYAEKPGGYMTRCLVWSYDPKIDGCRFFREPQPLLTKEAIEYIKKSMPTESLTNKKLAEYSEARTMAIQALNQINEIRYLISEYEECGWKRIEVAIIKKILEEVK